MQGLRESLGLKVLLLVSLLTVATISGVFLAQYYWQRAGTLQQVEAASQRTSNVVQMFIQEPMVAGDNESTKADFRKLGEKYHDIKMYLTDHRGVITYSTNDDAVRRTFDQVLDNPQAAGMAKLSLAEPLQRGAMLTMNGKPYYVEINSVMNNPRCHHCHGSSKIILGSMIMLQDLSPEMSHLKASLFKSGLISLVGLVILLSLLLLFMKKSVINRIMGIVDVTEEITAGNLDVSYEAKGSDELAKLSANLSTMVGKLKKEMAEAETRRREAATEAKKAQRAYMEADEAQKISKKLAEYQKREVENLSVTLRKLAEGDLTVKYQVTMGDEDTAEAYESFTEIEEALEVTTGDLSGIMANIQNTSEVLASSAEQLSTVSSSLLEKARNMSEQSSSVAGSAEEITVNINSMAAGVEEMSVNVNTVSSTAEEMSMAMNSVVSAVEELSASIQEIANNAEEGSKVAIQAADLAKDATQTMSKLGEAANEIGKVTDVIKRIADQTNLLALNATIEAASAGEAGKGFAVVAGEIKELANQSSKAAEDIANKIEGVQTDTQEAVEVIAEVTQIVDSINTYVHVITNAVNQQNKATNHIAVNVSETNKGVGNIVSSIAELAKGANDMSRNAGEIARGAQDVAANINSVNVTATDSSTGASQVNSSAKELAKLAGELQQMVRKFKIQ